MSIYYKITNLIWKIRCFFNPRQKWIKDYIEYYSYCDKVELIREFLFGCLIHYVEHEKGLEILDWNHSEEHKKAEGDIRECYNYIKIYRPNLILQIEMLEDDHFKNFEMIFSEPKDGYATCNFVYKDGYDESYRKLNEAEDELRKKDNEILIKILSVRDFLWT